jgi:hypothetical protein
MTPTVEPAGVSETDLESVHYAIEKLSLTLQNLPLGKERDTELRARNGLREVYAKLHKGQALRQQLADMTTTLGQTQFRENELRQQLAEMRALVGEAQALLRRPMQGPSARTVCGEWWCDDVSGWLNRAVLTSSGHSKTCDTNSRLIAFPLCTCGLDAALAPTSQPSRGKCETCEGTGFVPCIVGTHTTAAGVGEQECERCGGTGKVQDVVDSVDPEWSQGVEYPCPDCAQPSRGKSVECPCKDVQPDGLTLMICTRCARTIAEHVGVDCAQPERQGPEILNELIGEGKYRYNLNDDQISALRELIKLSPPPTDDIVAGLREAARALRHDSTVNTQACANAVDRAIAALEARK